MATVSDPYPSDGDTNGASPDIVLRWQAAADAAASYDIYVGTDQTAVVNGDGDVHFGPRSGTTYAPTRPLVAGKTYYWRVAQVNRGNQDPVEPGPVWSFRVFSSAGQPAGYEKGYATWAVNTMTPVNLCDALPDGAVSAPSVSVKLARCESTGFQLAIQPAFDRRHPREERIGEDLQQVPGELGVLPGGDGLEVELEHVRQSDQQRRSQRAAVVLDQVEVGRGDLEAFGQR